MDVKNTGGAPCAPSSQSEGWDFPAGDLVSFFRFLKALVCWLGDEIYGLFITAEPEEHPDASKDGQ